MAVTIQIKRKSGANPTTLASGELALRTDTGRVWVGLDGNTGLSEFLMKSAYAANTMLWANNAGSPIAINAATLLGKLSGVAGANFSMNSKRITNLADPADPQDAATKAYVDAARAGLSVKQSVRTATNTNGDLSTAFAAGQVVSNVTLATGDRILIKDQTTKSQNGIYVVQSSGAPVRAADLDEDADVTNGAFVFVEEGDYAETGWVLITDNPDVGTSDLEFTQFTGTGQISEGEGIVINGKIIGVNYGTGLTVDTQSNVLSVDVNTVVTKGWYGVYDVIVGSGSASSPATVQLTADTLLGRVGSNAISAIPIISDLSNAASGKLAYSDAIKTYVDNKHNAQTFINLTDTPTSFSGAAGMIAVVNSNANAIVFTNVIDGGSW